MTITAAPSEVTYAGDGVSTSFPIPFVFDTPADLEVVSTDAAGNAAVITSGFSVTGGSGSTGTLTLFSPLLSGATLTILDNPAITQDVDYIANDAFPADAHERALDRTVRICKRLYQLFQKSLHVADGDPAAGAGVVLGSVAARRGKYLFFNAITGAIEYAVAVATTTLSQSIIAQLLNPMTNAEIAAGVVVVNYWYKPYHVDRYATNAAPGTTDMTAAFQSAISAARRPGGGNNAYWGETGTYLTTSTLILSAYGVDGVNLICPTPIWYSAPQVCLITSTINGPTFNCSGQDSAHFAIAPLISGGSIQNLSTGASACVVLADYSGGLRIEKCWIRHNKRGISAPTSLCVSPRFDEVIVDSPTTVGANYYGDFWAGKWYGGRSYSADYSFDISGNDPKFDSVDIEFCQVVLRHRAISGALFENCHIETSQCLLTNATTVPINSGGAWVDNASAGSGITGVIKFHNGVISLSNANTNLVVIKNQASFNYTLVIEDVAITATNYKIGNSFAPGTGVALPSGTKIVVINTQPLADSVQKPPNDSGSGYFFQNSTTGQGFIDTSGLKIGGNELNAVYDEATYTPTWASSGTQPAIGNGTLTGRYTRSGNVIEGFLTLTAGNTTTFGTGTYSFSLPVAAGANGPAGVARADDTGTNTYVGNAYVAGGVLTVYTNASPAGLWGQTVPFTFGNTDIITIGFRYFTN